MEETINYSGDEEGPSCELPNFNLQFFDEPPAKSKRFANLSEKELSHLLEQRHSAWEHQKIYKLVCDNISR